MPNRTIDLIALISVAITLVAAFLYLIQRSIIFPAPPGVIPQALPAGIEHIALDQGHAFLALPANNEFPAPLIVFAHGNAELAQWSLEAFQFFRNRGFAILLLEYPGYAGTKGSPSSDSIRKAALQAVDQVLSRSDVDPNRIIAYGRSIGSGVACAIAANRSIAALVLESPFSAFKDLVREKGFPKFLVRDSFNNEAVVTAHDIPLFLYHGSNDQIIPAAHSERLKQLATQATLVTPVCGHNDCPRPWHEVMTFFVSHGLAEGGNSNGSH